MDKILNATKEFLKKAFVHNPSFSFDDWRIMYNHSLKVFAFSLRIADETRCDKLVISIGALLHDVGKTLKMDEQMLRKKHGKLAYVVSKNFIHSLVLTARQKTQLKNILSDRGASKEKKIIEDADIIAFFADEKLQGAFKNWAEQKSLYGELKRKIDKVEKLHFDVSKKIAKPFYEKLKKQWAPIDYFTGKRVTVMGLGLHGGGVSVALWLLKHGARVLITDLKTKKELGASIKKLQLTTAAGGVPLHSTNNSGGTTDNLQLHLGKHRKQDFIDTDMVVRNPAVPVESPFLNIARTHGVPIENEATLFFKHCQSKNIIGVTGTRGKSTTSAMIVHVLATSHWPLATSFGLQAQSQKPKARSPSRVWLAGNIRTTPMLSIVDRIKPDDWVVLELSSWHLEDMDWQKISPHIAVVTNMLQDHLNRYADMRSYARAKESIVRYQKKGDIAVLNKENTWTRAMAKKTKAKVIWFPNSRDPVSVNFQRPGLRSFRILGEHNLMNAQAAAAVARAIGILMATIRSALQKFRGLPDRLEYIRTVHGVRYYNDTTATTPDATIAALAALSKNHTTAFGHRRWRGPARCGDGVPLEGGKITPPPLATAVGGVPQDAVTGSRSKAGKSQKHIVLIAGGSDKKLNYKPLILWIKKTCKAVVLLPGSATKKIQKSMIHDSRFMIHVADAVTMSSAVHKAESLATRGDIILLSPAATSFGLFTHEFDRGDQFRRTVKTLNPKP